MSNTEPILSRREALSRGALLSAAGFALGGCARGADSEGRETFTTPMASAAGAAAILKTRGDKIIDYLIKKNHDEHANADPPVRANLVTILNNMAAAAWTAPTSLPANFSNEFNLLRDEANAVWTEMGSPKSAAQYNSQAALPEDLLPGRAAPHEPRPVFASATGGAEAALNGQQQADPQLQETALSARAVAVWTYVLSRVTTLG